MSYLFAAAEESEGPNVLAVPLDELIIGILAFLIVFGLLAKVALPSIKKTLAERTDKIEGGLARAEQAQAEAQQVLAEYREKLAAAHLEAADIRTAAQAERVAIVDSARGEAQQAAVGVAERAQAQIAAETSQAKSALSREVGQLSFELAGKIVGESLADDARAKAVVDRFIAELEAAPAAAEGRA
ncbi:MAG: F0F1 ATP synthase subunit B [Actinomycetia bacterium]|jgi:F-type H+-transporting ATPase subunit b|nr:F0F1 ATP synthase subunit B [Actinomycetes bacterium]